MSAPTYIRNLFRPNGSKPAGRKVWSIDLETVWLPFFTATNTDGLSLIPHEALGAPLRLAYEQDGTVKFNAKSGKPVVKVAKDVADAVRLVRENFVAGLQQFATQVQSKQGDDYKEQVRLNIEAGAPIQAKDKQALDSAIAQLMADAIAERQGVTEPEPVLEPATV